MAKAPSIMKPAYVIKIKDEKDLLDGDYGMAHKLNHKHPSWVGTYRLCYTAQSGLEYIERDNDFVVFEYMYSEKLTLEKALEICPEVLI